MTTLDAAAQTTINAADSPTIQNVFTNLARHLQANAWLDNSNRYRLETIKRLSKDASRSTIDHTSLAEYIAASAPLHCTDGWSFLGRALTCHAHGDSDAARHFAYYAELRGASTMLATEGIGIFSGRHYIVDTSSTCKRIPLPRDKQGTHKACWLVLEHWATLPRAADLISTVISPASVPLADWLNAFGAASALQPIGIDWLESWGLDLKRLSEDRDARNEASYRPTRLTSRASLDGSDSANFLYSLWNLHEPFAFSRFEYLDRHLLRLSLELAHKSVTGRQVQDDTANFSSSIDRTVNTISPGGLPENQWKNFLRWNADPDTPQLINEAGGDVNVTNPRHHLQVIARATLLLRLATGACAKLLNEAGVGRDELEFWWNPLGEDRGLWEPKNEPDDLTELWADVEVELENLAEWDKVNTGGSSIARWLNDRSRTINVLGGCERIALWGLGL